MVYDGEFTIANRYHNIPAATPIGNGEIAVRGHIMVVVFIFFDRSIEFFNLYQFTEKYYTKQP